MKNVFLVFMTLLCFVACQSDQAVQEVPTVELSGMIENAEEPEVRIYINDELTVMELEEGKFSYSFETEEAQLMNIRYGRNGASVFATPGSSIQLSMDAGADEPSFAFSGDLVDENTFWNSANKLVPRIPRDELFKMEEGDFLQAVNTRKTDLLSALTKIKSDKSIASSFEKMAQTDFNYDMAESLSMYESYHAYFAEKEDFKASAAISDEMNKFPVDDAENILSPNYKNFVYGVVTNSAWDDAEDFSEFSKNAMTAMNEKVSSPIVKDYVFYKIMDAVFMDGLQKSDEELFTQFKKESINPAYLAIVQEKYNKWEKLVEGKPAPNFDYKDMDGNSIGLDDLKGKVVYVDVWATWCGPCRAEHPALAELEHEFTDNPKVAFVGVSIDKDEDAWRKMLTEKELGGIQIIADKAGNSSITKDYLIDGIPRFLLIDEEGNIMNASAPRPSSGKVADLINNRLKRKTKEA